ncbi:hypothetical protein [Haloplanus salinarum]|uniref:hypothetical protein n=1 Tax=Haloplanus salinarum TaxID=1912324 RepID=UPI00214B4C78|nr:hypothetical protein [Haloplanus salinarum]
MGRVLIGTDTAPGGLTTARTLTAAVGDGLMSEPSNVDTVQRHPSTGADREIDRDAFPERPP